MFKLETILAKLTSCKTKTKSWLFSLKSCRKCDEPDGGNRAAPLPQVSRQSLMERGLGGRPEVLRRKIRLRRRRPKRECSRLKNN